MLLSIRAVNSLLLLSVVKDECVTGGLSWGRGRCLPVRGGNICCSTLSPFVLLSAALFLFFPDLNSQTALRTHPVDMLGVAFDLSCLKGVVPCVHTKYTTKQYTEEQHDDGKRQTETHIRRTKLADKEAASSGVSGIFLLPLLLAKRSNRSYLRMINGGGTRSRVAAK